MVSLLSTAIKNCRENGQVSVDCVATEQGTIRFTIADDGPGIAAQRIEELLDPLLQIDQEGFGEGSVVLALTRKMVEFMEGSLSLESTAGESTTYWIDPPAADGP
jgi:signal transduction histidine kinase